MRSTFLYMQNRAARRVTVALFATAAIAACDSDHAVAPTPAAAKLPTSGSSAIIPGGRGDLFIGPVNGDMTPIKVAGSSYDVINSVGDTMHVADNGQYDSDPALGNIKLSKVLAGKYEVCPIVAPNGYAFPYLNCMNLTLVAGSAFGIGFLGYQTPSIWWEVRSTAQWMILGGTYKVGSTRFGRAGKPIDVTDNGPNDLDATVGRVAFKVGGIGGYSVCEATPPKGFFAAITPCLNVTNSSGGTTWAGQFNNQEKQVPNTP